MSLTNWVLEGFSNHRGNLYALKVELDIEYDTLVCSNKGLTSFQEVPASSIQLSSLLEHFLFTDTVKFQVQGSSAKTVPKMDGDVTSWAD